MTALIFDMDDTLYDLAEPFRQAFAFCFGDRYAIDVERLFKYNRLYSDQVFEASESGEISMTDMYVYRLQKAMEEFHISVTKDEALAFQKAYEHFQHEISLSDEMRNCLEEISRENIFTGIISNGEADHQMDKVRILGLDRWFSVDHILISGACAYSKPDTRIFLYAQKLWHLKPEETWYIGDTYYNDIVGPNEAGWHTVWYNHRKNEKPEGAAEPDFTVSTEKELIGQVLDMAKQRKAF